MQRTAIAALGLLLAGCASQPALTDYTVNSGAQRSPDQQALVFEHADLGLRIDPDSRSLRGDALLTFGTRAPLDRIELDLDRNLPIDAITVDGQPLAANQWRNPDGKLTVTLPRRLAPGSHTDIRVTYHGEPHVAKRAPWDGGFVWAHTPDGKPWVASAVEGEGCDLFWPCIDHPMGKPAVVDEHITVPAPLGAAGNGVSLGMTEANGWRTWHWRAKHPSTYGIAINVGPYEVLSGDYRSRYGNVIPLRLWYLPQNKAHAKDLFAEFPQMLDFFESTIGPYPFADEKMGVVETPHKGMEHQTINAYGNKYAKTATTTCCSMNSPTNGSAIN
jgi:aminopeptidase N